jgi:hypothetical protein
MGVRGREIARGEDRTGHGAGQEISARGHLCPPLRPGRRADLPRFSSV